MLTDYHVTFKDEGPLGMVIENIDGLAVVVSYSCASTGEAGPAARLGVSLGSVIVGISRHQCRPLYKEIVPALMKASRPVRLEFQRPAQLLQAVPAPLPLLLWHGSATLCVVREGRGMSSCTKTSRKESIEDGKTAVGHLDSIVSSPLSLELISDPHVGFRLVFRWSALPNVVFQPTKINIKNGNRVTESDIREQIEQQAELSNLKFSVEGKFTAASSCKATLTLKEGEVNKEQRKFDYNLVDDANAAPENFEMIMDDASSHTTLRKLLACRLFPTEVAFQAHGFVGPRVLLEGLLEKWETPMISGEWRTFWFRLRSDGSLQWFLPDLYSGAKTTRKKFVPYPHRPRGGLCISNAAVSSNANHIQKISRLKANSLKQMCAFSVEDDRTTLIVRPPYTDNKGYQHAPASRDAIKQAWIEAFIRDKRLSKLLQTGDEPVVNRAFSADKTLASPNDHGVRSNLSGNESVDSFAKRHSIESNLHTPEKLRSTVGCDNLLSSFDETSRSVEYLYRFSPPPSGVCSPFLQTRSRLRGTTDDIENRLSKMNAPFERYASPMATANRESSRSAINNSASQEPAHGASSRLLRCLQMLFGQRQQHTDIRKILKEALRPEIRAELEELSADPKKIFEHPTDVFETLVKASYDLDDYYYIKQHLPPLRNLEELKLEREQVKKSQSPQSFVSSFFSLLGRLRGESSTDQPSPANISKCTNNNSTNESRENSIPEQRRLHDGDSQSITDELSTENLDKCTKPSKEHKTASALKQQAFHERHSSMSTDNSNFAHFERERALSLQTNDNSNSSQEVQASLKSKDKYPLFLRRHNFIQLVGHYLGPLCDQYSAGAVFDALVDDTLPVSFRVRAMLSPGDEDLRPLKEVDTHDIPSTHSITSSDDLLDQLSEENLEFLYHKQQQRRNAVQATLRDSWVDPANRIDRFERVLTAEPFARYVLAIERSIISQHSGWEWLRHKLDLESTELCVRVEEYMHLSMAVRLSAPKNPFMQLDAALGAREFLSRSAASPSDVHVKVTDDDHGQRKLFSVRIPLIMMIPATVLRDILLWLPHDRQEASSRLSHAADLLRSECFSLSIAAGQDVAQRSQDVLNHFLQLCELLGLQDEELMEQRGRAESNSESSSTNEGMGRAPMSLERLPPAYESCQSSLNSHQHPHTNDELSSMEHLGSEESSQSPKKNGGHSSAAEESVYSKGYGSVRLSGTAYITDQNLFFLPSRQEVICFPLPSVSEVDYCTVEKSISLKGVDDCGLHLRSCEIRRIGCGNEEVTQTQTLLAAASRVSKADGHILTNHQVEQWRKEMNSFAERLRNTQLLFFQQIFEVGSWCCQHGGVESVEQSSPEFLRYAFPGKKYLHYMDEVDEDLKVSVNIDKERITEILPDQTPTFISVLSSKEISCSGQVLPSATLMFSRMKDTLLTRGEERSGGRRRVVAEILKEMLAANKIKKHHPVLCSSATAHCGARALVNKRSGVKEEDSLTKKGFFTEWKETLARDLSEDRMLERRLNIWAALNVIRTRALLKATGRCVTSLLQCTEYYSYYRTLKRATKEPSTGAGSYVRLPSGGTVTLLPLKALQYWVYGHKEGMALEYVRINNQVSTGPWPVGDPAASEERFLREEHRKDKVHRREELWQAALSNSPAVIQLLCEREPQWLLHSARYVSRAERFEQERKAMKLRAGLGFQSLQRHLIDFNQLFIRTIHMAYSMYQYVLRWHSPYLTLFIFVFLLLLPWYDLMVYTVPIFLLVLAGIVLLTGSMIDLDYSPFERFQDNSSTKKRWVFQRVRSFTRTLNENLSVANEFMQKMHSLVTWKDPQTTRTFVIALIVLSLTFSLVPSRYIFGPLVLHQFTRPLRKKKPGLIGLSLRRLYAKLPAPSESYSVYSPHDKLKTIDTEYPVDAVAPGTQRKISVLRTRSGGTQNS